MSAVGLLFILLLCHQMHASNARLLEADASGTKSHRSTTEVAEKIKLMIRIETYREGVTKAKEKYHETSNAKDVVKMEALDRIATEVKHGKRTDLSTIPTTMGRRVTASPGLFSDYSQPKMRPPSHN